MVPALRMIEATLFKFLSSRWWITPLVLWIGGFLIGFSVRGFLVGL